MNEDGLIASKSKYYKMLGVGSYVEERGNKREMRAGACSDARSSGRNGLTVSPIRYQALHNNKY